MVALQVVAGTGGPQKATITLEVDGQQETREATGDGPVDAIFKAIKAIVPHEARLPLYQVMAVTEGTDAQAEVMVRLEEDGRQVTGRGVGHRHDGRVGPRLCGRSQQAHDEAPAWSGRADDGELTVPLPASTGRGPQQAAEAAAATLTFHERQLDFAGASTIVATSRVQRWPRTFGGACDVASGLERQRDAETRQRSVLGRYRDRSRNSQHAGPRRRSRHHHRRALGRRRQGARTSRAMSSLSAKRHSR